MKDSSGGHRCNPCILSIAVFSMFIFILPFIIIPHSDVWYCNNVIFKKFGCIKWISIVTRSHYWILGKNVDLSGSPLGCARRIPSAVAYFQGA